MLELFIFLTALFGFLFVIYMLTARARGARIAGQETELGDLRKKLEESRNDLKSVKDELSSSKPELNDLRSKYRSAKKDSFEAEEKIRAAAERAAEAEKNEKRAIVESSKLKEETALAVAEAEKAKKFAEAKKTEAEAIGAKIKELEAKIRQAQSESDPKASDKARATIAALNEDVSRIRAKIAREREEALERARALERVKRQLHSTQTAYNVLRGQYNALHDRMLGMMGLEGKADEGEDHVRGEIAQAQEAALPESAPHAPAPVPEEKQV